MYLECRSFPFGPPLKIGKYIYHLTAWSLNGSPLESAVTGRDAEDERDERHEHLAEALLDVAGRLCGEGEEVDDAVVGHVHDAHERHLAQLLGVR